MTEAIYYQALDAVKTGIQALTMEGLDDSRIRLEPIADDEGKLLPFISVIPAEPETLPTGDDDGGNAADRVDYKIVVAIVAAKNEVATMFPRVLKWREQIRVAFHLQRLSGVSQIQYTEVQPLEVISRSAWHGKGLLVSALRIVCISQETR